MTSFSPFIRKTSLEMRPVLAKALRIAMPPETDWNDTGLVFAKVMVGALDSAQAADKAGAVFALERMAAMADEVGDVAMDSVARQEFEGQDLTSVQDRVIWLFINFQHRFRQAEEARFIDDRRRKRSWYGVVTTRGLKVNAGREAEATFKEQLKAKLTDGQIQIDIFERVRRGFDGTEYRIVQVSIYAEGPAQIGLEFQDTTLASVARRPVIAAALTYEPQSGAVEVTASSKDKRAVLVGGFLKVLLAVEGTPEDLPLLRYDLSGLKRPHAFKTDVQDRIEGVSLRSLRLMPFGDEDHRLTIEVGRTSGQTIWEVAKQQFGDHDPLGSGWLITSAGLLVTFRAQGTSRRGKTISLQITEPNGCDLKDRTELEQLIGNKYLKAWGLLLDDSDLLAD